MSFDVVSLFTSAPLDAARTIVLDRLSNNSLLEDHTTISIAKLTKALDLCLNSSYFKYDSMIYKQVVGTLMAYQRGGGAFKAKQGCHKNCKINFKDFLRPFSRTFPGLFKVFFSGIKI